MGLLFPLHKITMSSEDIVDKVIKEINESKCDDVNSELEKMINENIEELSKNQNIFNLSLQKIFTIFSKVHFKLIDDSNKAIQIISNIIKNTIASHPKEKETLLLLQYIDYIPNTLWINETISLLAFFESCPIINHLVTLYEEIRYLPEKDYEHEIQEKIKENEELKKQIKEVMSMNFDQILEKPNDLQTDIFCACNEGKIKSVQWLIEKECTDINTKASVDDYYLHIWRGQTPLLIACENGHLSIALYLIFKGANLRCKDNYGNYVIHAASKGGLLSIVQYSIYQQNFDKDVKGYESLTPLHYASEYGHLQIVEYLISISANIEAIDENGKTALLYASQNGHLQIVEYLISRGADINVKDEDGDYSIHYACAKGHLPIVNYFIEKQNVDIDIKGHGEMTPLQYACENGHIKIAEYLISKNADINATDEDRNSPIHYACENGHLQIVKYLIENKNVDKNIRGYMDRTPLHFACENGHMQIVKYLISKGANIEAKDEDGNTPLHCASLWNKTAIMDYLVASGANKKAKNNDKKTPYHVDFAC